MPKRMKMSARKPKTVVAAEAAMEEKDSLMAMRMASSGSGTSLRWRSKLLSRKMA